MDGLSEFVDDETGEVVERNGETLPTIMSRASRLLSEATTSAELLEARDTFNLAYDVAKSAGRMARKKAEHDEVMAALLRAQGDCLIGQARAKMLLADAYDDAQERGEVAGQGRPKNLGDGKVLGKPKTADIGLRYDEIHEARQLRDADRESPGIVEEVVEAIIERGEEPTKAAVAREIGNYRTVTKGENEWYTPAEFIQLARNVMGGIDLDPASCAEANETVGAGRYFTKEDDGLAQAWAGRVWLNPPYSRELMPAFADKLRNSVLSGDVQAAIMVTHNTTDTGWFHRLAPHCAALCFPSRRIRFYRGEDVAAPVNGQMFMYFGSDRRKFAEVFSATGLVVAPL
jgi:hypothetical protein